MSKKLPSWFRPGGAYNKDRYNKETGKFYKDLEPGEAQRLREEAQREHAREQPRKADPKELEDYFNSDSDDSLFTSLTNQAYESLTKYPRALKAIYDNTHRVPPDSERDDILLPEEVEANQKAYNRQVNDAMASSSKAPVPPKRPRPADQIQENPEEEGWWNEYADMQIDPTDLQLTKANGALGGGAVGGPTMEMPVPDIGGKTLNGKHKIRTMESTIKIYHSENGSFVATDAEGKVIIANDHNRIPWEMAEICHAFEQWGVALNGAVAIKPLSASVEFKNMECNIIMDKDTGYCTKNNSPVLMFADKQHIEGLQVFASTEEYDKWVDVVNNNSTGIMKDLSLIHI